MTYFAPKNVIVLYRKLKVEAKHLNAQFILFVLQALLAMHGKVGKSRKNAFAAWPK
jgi:hypothetical protein